jgi:hypothetical protein
MSSVANPAPGEALGYCHICHRKLGFSNYNSLWIRTAGNQCLRRYTAVGDTMATESLTEVVRWLTPQEQEAVRQFIDYLKPRDDSARSQSPFPQAADEFIAEHPELRQRLAQ